MRKRTKIRFSVEQATQIILNRPSDPNMTMRKRKLMKAKLTLKNKQMAPGIIYRGEHIHGGKKHPPTCSTGVNENSFSPLPVDVAQWTPLRYFKQFGDDEITDVLVKQTISYSIEK